MSGDTIFALSSGALPSAIGVVRVSGPAAGAAMRTLVGREVLPRRAVLHTLCRSDGAPLDRAMVLWLPGPRSATGEDTLELHCHGGRAVIAAVEAALGEVPGLRRAAPGEFTRRAFANGRIDLAEAEGLADLLAAETEGQRRAALAAAGGALSRQIEAWRVAVLEAGAAVEAALDFADEDAAGDLPPDFSERLEALHGELAQWLARPRAERLRDGFRVVIAGPPNAGKSTLFNALVENEAAITAPTAGTTRDLLSQSVALAGVPLVLVDTAGLRADGADPIEAIGIARASAAIEQADLVLWLGDEGKGPPGSWEIAAQCDRAGLLPKSSARHRISAQRGDGLDALRRDLVAAAQSALPVPGTVALNIRQHRLIDLAATAIVDAANQTDPLLTAESLRQARAAFDSLLGRATTEDMLDSLFGRFCIGK